LQSGETARECGFNDANTRSTTKKNDQEKRPSLEVKAGTSARQESREIRENKQLRMNRISAPEHALSKHYPAWDARLQ
jgi:hypothetical protein